MLAIELRGEPFPTFWRRPPRHGCQPCLRGSRLPSRVPSALSPSGPALAAHTLDQDSPADGNVSRAGDGCGVLVVKPRWHDHRPASQTGQGGACSRSARNRRSPPSPGLSSGGWKAAPFESRAARPSPSSSDQRPGRLLMVAPPRSAPPAAAPPRRPMIINYSPPLPSCTRAT